MNLAVTIAAIEGAIGPIILWLVRIIVKQLVESITANQTDAIEKIIAEKMEAHIQHDHGRTGLS